MRVVNSRGKEQYSINARNLFDENYALASTQGMSCFEFKSEGNEEGGRVCS